MSRHSQVLFRLILQFSSSSFTMMPAPNRVILVTGANRGIGQAIVQALALNKETLHSTFLLGCRDPTNGEKAIEELRSLGVTSAIVLLALDVSSDATIQHAVQTVEEKYAHLNVLVNNAGYAAIPSADDIPSWRGVYGKVNDVNVTSVALMTQLFLPLLRKAPGGGGKVINVSSARGSTSLSANGTLPPTVSIPYSVSKAALNMLTVEMSRDPANKDVEFQLVSPGHCKTAFNGYRGTRDPVEGANVVVKLVKAEKGMYKNAGFWETKGASLDLVEIPW
jgi:NAD(P)-dependent dehydrogenase (short-subunit alcohol dehydrogenase family)